MGCNLLLLLLFFFLRHFLGTCIILDYDYHFIHVTQIPVQEELEGGKSYWYFLNVSRSFLDFPGFGSTVGSTLACVIEV